MSILQSPWKRGIMSGKGVVPREGFAFLEGLISGEDEFLQRERGPKYRRDRRVIYRFDVCQLI
jgi:hypothetical protein